MPKVIHLNSMDQIRAAAADWDDLWQRSDSTSPLARAEPVCDWLAHFAPSGGFHALIVAEQGRWCAALPLVERRLGGMIRAGVLPCNAWPSGATLLCDARATDDPLIGRTLLAGAAELPWPLVFLEAVRPDRISWRALFHALTSAGLAYDLRTRWEVGRLRLEPDWPAAFGRLSRRHRQRISVWQRKLEQRGEVSFRLHTGLPPDEVEPLLYHAWETEDRGWKGAAGSSVLRVPGAAEFMLAQARWLAAHGQLLLAFLDCGQRNVAFCYGALGKGVLNSYKIGFDPEFAAISPGHLLQYHLLQMLFQSRAGSELAFSRQDQLQATSVATLTDPEVHTVDYVGPLTEYHASWRPDVYPFARLAFARPGSLLGRASLWGFQRVKGPSEGFTET
jgi:CelD/BcsL family acetyltransferase involved in cellulose biosynthesis